MRLHRGRVVVAGGRPTRHRESEGDQNLAAYRPRRIVRRGLFFITQKKFAEYRRPSLRAARQGALKKTIFRSGSGRRRCACRQDLALRATLRAPRKILFLPSTKAVDALHSRNINQGGNHGLRYDRIRNSGRRFAGGGWQSIPLLAEAPRAFEMVRSLDIERGGAEWDEPAQSVILDSADLDRLESAVVKGKLTGFIFRGDHLQAHDLEFIAKARAVLAAGMMVEIVAWW